MPSVEDALATKRREGTQRATTPAKDIDAYIRAFPDDVRPTLQKVRRTIARAAPEAIEAISYGIPAFKMNGQYVVYFAGHKNHIGMYPRPTGQRAFETQVSPYRHGKRSIRFPLRAPIPYDLVKQVVVLLVKENRARTS